MNSALAQVVIPYGNFDDGFEKYLVAAITFLLLLLCSLAIFAGSQVAATRSRVRNHQMKTTSCRPQNDVATITHACIDEKSISPQWLINASATTPENNLVMVLAHTCREPSCFDCDEPGCGIGCCDASPRCAHGPCGRRAQNRFASTAFIELADSYATPSGTPALRNPS
jgi:hypothetical protein